MLNNILSSLIIDMKNLIYVHIFETLIEEEESKKERKREERKERVREIREREIMREKI